MNIFRIFRELPNASEYINFNEQNRRKWVEQVAMSLPPNTKILDVGAGEGQYKPLFSHCQYQAQDFAQFEGVKEGVHKQSWNYVKLDYVSDITAIPVEDETFDAILCTEVLEHVPEPIRAIEEMARILKPGGKLFLSAPLGSGLHQIPYHFYGGYTPYFYQWVLPKFNLEIVSIEPNGGFFKHYLQESARAGKLSLNKYYRSKYHPMRYIVGFLLVRLFPVIFYNLDKSYFIEEHTVGFFVTAQKKKPQTEDVT